MADDILEETVAPVYTEYRQQIQGAGRKVDSRIVISDVAGSYTTGMMCVIVQLSRQQKN